MSWFELPPSQGPRPLPPVEALVPYVLAVIVFVVAAIVFREVRTALMLFEWSMSEQDGRSLMVVVWLTACLLPWPGRPGLWQRMVCSTVMGFGALLAVILHRWYGWFDGLFRLFEP